MLLDWIDMAKLLITILLPLAFLAFTKAESDGPPQEACVSMMPDHYGLTFTKDNVKIDATKNPDGSLAISCELDDGAEFKGWRFFPILIGNYKTGSHRIPDSSPIFTWNQHWKLQ